GAGAFGGAQVFAVTVGRQEPDDVQTHKMLRVACAQRRPWPVAAQVVSWRIQGYSACWAMLLGGVQITSLMLSFFGISLSAVKVSAIFCWARTTAGVIGLAP